MSNRPAFSRIIIYLIRHGQNIDDASSRWAGTRDYGLTPFGKLQSQALSNSLKLRRFDKIYSSTLRRAKQTAEFIHSLHPSIPLIESSLLIEQNLGKCQGQSYNDKTLPPFEETSQELYSRASEFWNEIKQEKGSLVIVSHALFLASFLHFLCDKYGVEKPTIFYINTGWTSLSIEEGRLRILEINQNGHLDTIHMTRTMRPRQGKAIHQTRRSIRDYFNTQGG